MHPAASPSPTRYVAGCMTGTSLDALDAALVAVDGQGLSMHATFRGLVSVKLPQDLRAALRQLAQGQPAPPIDYMHASRALGTLHAQAVGWLCAQCLPADSKLAFVAAHGQTIWHAPPGLSWQLFDPWPVVRALGVPVCYDLRQADLVAGGQGAPITPLADWVLLRDASLSRLVVNLGGICNVTLLPAGGDPSTVRGEDIGPCNLLLDGVLHQVLSGWDIDLDGKLAARGGASSILYRLLIQAPFFARPRPRSTGREDFTPAWIEALVRDAGLRPHDALASAADAVARLVTAAVGEAGPVQQVILAGGGTHNRNLTQRIREHCRSLAQVTLIDELGLPASAREAVAMAVLGALSRDGQAITLPAVTGAEHPGVAGTWAGR